MRKEQEPGPDLLLSFLDDMDQDFCSGEEWARSLFADLVAFQDLLQRWQKVQNLVSRETLNMFWTRHALDSLQLLAHLPTGVKRIVDVGSGGGFPAIPMAAALRDRGVDIHLVDSNRRKVSFLRAVSRELELGLSVHDCRIEALALSVFGDGGGASGGVDVITSRATAPLGRLLALTRDLWGAETVGIFHKGVEFGEELKQARAKWQFDVVCCPSKTDKSGKILELRDVRPVV